MLTHLQHFDLASDVQSSFDFWQETSPILMLWDNHDIKTVKTHGLLWEAGVGKGRLLVSMLNHSPENSSIGPYLLDLCLRHANSEALPKKLSDTTVQRLNIALNSKYIDLSKAPWKFRIDQNAVGFKQHWNLPDNSTDDWSAIKIDSHWEGQGHDNLDGWAWYATEVTVPNDWDASEYYLCFTGVDDHYQVYVNGTKIGQAGVIQTKETAFEMRTSHPLPKSIQAGDTLSIRIAVYDWYGAGGIFRPIFLRTSPLSDLPPILVD